MIKIKCTSAKPDKANVCHTLLVGKTYTVGRKGCDISFPDDQSISRNHAEIVIEHPMANMTDPLLTPTLVITDLGSKFGTFANDGIERKSKMAMREALNLSPGDRFKFGLQWNEYQILYTPIIVTPSAIREPLLHKLKTTVMTLGGHMVSEWEEGCQYVVMESLTLTVKAVCGLLSASHIVTPAFFLDLLESVKTNKAPPKPFDYLPELSERNISSSVSFEPNTARSNLFQGKVFVFATSKHLKKLSTAVHCGGGTCKLLSDIPTRDIHKEKYIIMKPSERDMFVDNPVRKLLDDYKNDKKAPKRLIQDSEIGLAAVFGSLEKHCNPTHNFLESLRPPSQVASTQGGSEQPVIVGETQETQLSDWNGSRNQIPETFVQDPDASTSNVKVKQEPTSQNGVAIKRDADTKLKAEGEPSSKKRAAAEALSHPNTRGKRNRIDKPSQQQQSIGALSAIFGGLSDDSDEEILPSAVVIPETQDEPESATMNPNVQYSMPMYDDVVPPSSEDESVQLAQPSPTRSLRSTRGGTAETTFQKPSDKSNTTVLNSTTVPGGSTRKRKLTTPDVSPVKLEPAVRSSTTSARTPTKKLRKDSALPRVKPEVDVNTDLLSRTENLTIKPDSFTEYDGIATPCIPEIRVPLLKAPLKPRLQVIQGKQTKNYKQFQKVPLAIAASGSGNNLSGSPTKSGASGRSNRSRAAGRNVSHNSLRMHAVEYCPLGVPGQHRPSMDDGNISSPAPNEEEQPSPVPIKRRATEDEENDVMEIDSIMPDTTLPPQTQRQNAGNILRSSSGGSSRPQRRGRSSKQEPEDDPMSEQARSIPSPQPVRNTRGRRNVKQVVIDLEDENDDDMFAF